jgi:hypothetical protein
MKQWLHSLTAVVISTSSICAAFAESMPTRQVLGGVQFWSRECQPDLRCELPAAIGEVYVVRGQITKPEKPSAIGHFSETIEQENLRLELQVFWINPSNELPHLVFQQRLLKRTNDIWLPVSECSQYVGEDAPRAFPVGVCSGYSLQADGIQQWGATFIKAP